MNYVMLINGCVPGCNATINMSPAAPSSDPETGIPIYLTGTPITFTLANTSSYCGTDVSWNFGDSDTYTTVPIENSVNHTYECVGDFIIGVYNTADPKALINLILIKVEQNPQIVSQCGQT